MVFTHEWKARSVWDLQDWRSLGLTTYKSWLCQLG